jgi:predicted dehydrogenase
MYTGVSPRVHIYAPLGPDLVAHLSRLAGFNCRDNHPTRWQMEVHACPDFLERMVQERPGNVLVLSGRNRGKIDAIQAAVEAGINVLADKPWILVPDDLPRLEAVLDEADQKGLVAYDIMTERFEITSILQRELVNDPETFGEVEAGSEERPGVYMRSVHYLMKLVAGVPNRRPNWFFDVHQQGEGLTDVGTHLVDLVPWVLFPDQAISCRQEIEMRAGRRWPTSLSRADFQKVTGASDFPAFLAFALKDDRLDYYCNTQVDYKVRGIHVQLHVLWDFEAAPGVGDSHLAIFRGTRSQVEIRQGAEENYRPELYVVYWDAAVPAAVTNKVEALQALYPGLGVLERGPALQITIPDYYRIGHEAHFAQVTRRFLDYLRNPGTLPDWEKPNMLAKYFVTTQGVSLARR